MVTFRNRAATTPFECILEISVVSLSRTIDSWARATISVETIAVGGTWLHREHIQPLYLCKSFHMDRGKDKCSEQCYSPNS